MNIEIPKRLKKRPMFHGIPIPFTAFIRPDGTPDFKVTDHRSWLVCVKRKQCGLCGQLLLPKEYYFIGGELSCSTRSFYDPPMHRECAEYAFKVCPFLACQKGYSKASSKPIEGVVIVIDENTPKQRPNKMGILLCKGWRMIEYQGSNYFQAEEIISVEWRD